MPAHHIFPCVCADVAALRFFQRFFCMLVVVALAIKWLVLNLSCTVEKMAMPFELN